MNRSRKVITHSQAGFTLVEVLVALVILAVGLLGLAGMQVLGLKNIGVAGTNASAAIIANELAERMHMNPDNGSDYTGLTSGSCPSTATRAARDYCDALGQATGDLDHNGSIDTDETRQLRAFTGTQILAVADCASCAANMYTITVSWAQQDYTGTDQLRTYSFNIRP